MGKSGISKIPRKKRAIAFGMMLDALDGERAYMLKTIPAPMRMLLPVMTERPWRKYAATLRTGTSTTLTGLPGNDQRPVLAGPGREDRPLGRRRRGSRSRPGP